MKLKSLLLLPIFFSSVHAEKLDDATKKALADEFRIGGVNKEEIPDDLGVSLIFVDLNNDGKLEALASAATYKYQDGWIWILHFRDKLGKWEEKLFPETDVPEKQGIFAFPEDFYIYKGKDKPAHVLFTRLVLTEDPYNEDPPITPGEEWLELWSIEFDAKGTMLLKDKVIKQKKDLKDYEQLKVEVFGE
jgi:hypothetical protein